MQEVDINTLVNENNHLNENIPNDIIIVCKIDELIIKYKYDQLDLSKVKCDTIYYYNQEGESIKNHILPNSLKVLYCDYNQLTTLPDFSHIDHKLTLSFIQDLPISFIPYTMNIELYKYEPNQINIEGYPYNPITNQEELNRYMKYIKNYQLNRIKSARK